jgi:L-malate glycosyltransferase
MHIGIIGPASLDFLAGHVSQGQSLPKGYQFPQNSLLILEMIRQGHSVSLFTTSTEVDRPTQFRGESLSIYVGRYRPRHRARDLFKQEILDLVDGIQSDRCDAYGAHWLYEFAHAGIQAKVPLAITVRDWPPQVLRFNPSAYRAMRLLMGMWTLRSFKGEFIAVSPYMATLVKKWAGREAVVVPNGIEQGPRTDLSIPWEDRKRVIVCIANGFDRRKNVKTLLRAMPVIREKNEDVGLCLIGAGMETGGAAASWAKNMGLDRCVEFLGSLPYTEVQESLASAMVLVHPSFEESFGRTLIEAMNVGTPVVGGARSGGVPWVLDNGGAGVLTDVSSPEAIAQAVMPLFDERERWESAAVSGRAHVRRQFSLEETTKEYVRVLMRVRSRWDSEDA